MRHLAGHLQHRLGEARDLIDMQNGVLRGKQTSSGVAVKLKLDLRDELEPELRTLYGLLDPRRGRVDAMDQTQRQEIMDAFADAIGLVSSEHWQEAGGLETLLDYRGWLRVDLYEVGVLARRKGVGELRISKQVSGIGSGGERAWMIYMPLLAALSGQADRTEHGPKIVPMDEALAKVDVNGAAEFFNALSDFGMSCMLTSEKLSPTSPRRGSLSSYQCETVADAVFVMHTYWDADRRERLEDRAEQLAAELLH